MKAIGTISRPIEILLRFSGLWPDSLCVPFCRFCWATTLVIFQAFQYRYIINHLHSIDSINLSDLMDSMSVTLAYMLISIKLVILWFNQRTLNKILAMIAMDLEQNIDTDFSAPAMTSKAYLSHRFTKFIVGVYGTAVIIYGIVIFTFGLINQETETSEKSTRPLIIKMDLPFDSDRRFVYEIVMISQFLHMFLCSCTNAMLNALLIAMIVHVSDQIDILCGWLVEIFPKGEKYGLQVTTMKKIIKTHQKIIIFSESIEKLYSYITMMQFLTVTFIICSLGFILVTSIGTPDAFVIIMRTILFYCVMNMEAFTFCFAGEYLSTKSKTIGDAAYNSLWYETDFKDSQIILFLIMRSQNQLTIRMGKVMDLSLSRFSDIIKASASYVSVLLAMS